MEVSGPGPEVHREERACRSPPPPTCTPAHHTHTQAHTHTSTHTYTHAHTHTHIHTYTHTHAHTHTHTHKSAPFADPPDPWNARAAAHETPMNRKCTFYFPVFHYKSSAFPSHRLVEVKPVHDPDGEDLVVHVGDGGVVIEATLPQTPTRHVQRLALPLVDYHLQ